MECVFACRGKGRPRKRGFVGTPVIVDHLAQLRRKEQGFSTGYVCLFVCLSVCYTSVLHITLEKRMFVCAPLVCVCVCVCACVRACFHFGGHVSTVPIIQCLSSGTICALC